MRSEESHSRVHVWTCDGRSFRLEAAENLESARLLVDEVSLDLAVTSWTSVLAALEATMSAARAKRGGGRGFALSPGRRGADWTQQEAAELASAYKAGSSVAALALAHQRTTGAVEAQLVRLGLIAWGEREYAPPPSRS